MTIGSVAFVPCAPLLVPAVAGGSASLDEDLRSASRAAVRRLVASDPTVIVVVAPTFMTGAWPGSSSWDFAGFGVPRPEAPTGEQLPWQLGLGAWLLDDAGWADRRQYLGVGVTTDGELPEISRVGRTAVLAVGDGSACRSEKAPGYLDPRAEAFDAGIAAALGSGDVAALGATDPLLGQELLCAGLPVWHWLATEIAGATVTSATVAYDQAPYGVAYFVASWLLE